MTKAKETRLVNFAVILIAALIFMVCAGLTANATTYNECESNDFVSQADTVSIAKGNVIRGYKGEDDQDFFKFTFYKFFTNFFGIFTCVIHQKFFQSHQSIRMTAILNLTGFT